MGADTPVSIPGIERASAADAADCADLILASAEHFLPAVFGPRIRGALIRMAAGRGTLFSHEHAWMARADGAAAGILLGYTGLQKAAEDPATGLRLFGALGPGLLLRLSRLLRLQRSIGALAPDEYYVSNVAVRPEFRGQGIGSLLLERARAEAAEAGAAWIVLDVETDNEGARRLYERLGFSRRSETRPLVLDGTPFSFYRMGRPVRDPD